MNGKEILVYLSHLYEGDAEKMLDHIRAKKPVNPREVEAFAASVTTPYITLFDDIYPEDWKQLFLPPLVCYYEGDVSLLKDLKRSVTYVGSRDASRDGLALARQFGQELAKNDVMVISGLARGIDHEAMAGAMEEKGKVIGISGAGIDIDYPSISKDIYEYTRTHGLLLSEYPKGVSPAKNHFPLRNRLLAATGKVTIVGEAELRSGSLITASYAINLGKDVGCLPSLASKGSGTNALIKDGAFLIDEVSDVLSLIGLKEKNNSTL